MEAWPRHPFQTVSTPLLGRSLAELESWAVEEGQPPFRGRQIHEWLYRRGVHDLSAITVLPRGWREALQERQAQLGHSLIGRLVEQHRQVAEDGTTKLILGTFDGLQLETVGIPTDDRQIGRAHV